MRTVILRRRVGTDEGTDTPPTIQENSCLVDQEQKEIVRVGSGTKRQKTGSPDCTFGAHSGFCMRLPAFVDVPAVTDGFYNQIIALYDVKNPICSDPQ